MSTYCPACRAALGDGARFCADCGREVPPPSEIEKAQGLLEAGAITQEEYDQIRRAERDKELEQVPQPSTSVVSPRQSQRSVGREVGGCFLTVVLVFVLIAFFVCGLLSMISSL